MRSSAFQALLCGLLLCATSDCVLGESQHVKANGTVRRIESADSIDVDQAYEPPEEGGWSFKAINDTRGLDDTSTTSSALYIYANWSWIPIWQKKASPDTDTSACVAIGVWEDVILGENAAETWFLVADGELVAPGSEGSGGDVVTWAGEVDGATVSIVRVPKYLYANATAAIPVTFKIEGMGSQVQLSSVTVSWSGTGTSGELLGRTTTMDANNNEVAANTADPTDTYTAWVPVSLVQSDIEGDTSDTEYFTVTVCAKEATALYPAITLSSVKDDDWDSTKEGNGCNPKVYGDVNVKVVELYQPNQLFSPLESQTKQERCDRPPSGSVWHVGDSKDPVGIPHPYPSVGHACPHCGVAQPYIQRLPDWFTSFSWTYTGPAEDAKTEVNEYIQIYDEDVSEGWQTIELRSYDATVGFAFGASYAHRSVCVLSGEKGMDLDNGTIQPGVPVQAFDAGHATIYVAHADGTDDLAARIAGVAESIYDMVTAGVAVAYPGWGAAMYIVKSAAQLVTSATTAPAEDAKGNGTGLVAWSWTVIHNGVHTSENQDMLIHYGVGQANPKSQAANLNKTGMCLRVGDTYVGAVRVNAMGTLKSLSRKDDDDRNWDSVIVYAKYQLSSGTFADNIVNVQTSP